MKRKNATRNALLTSIISMLLCVSMLVGATFAWFTDEVVTGMNTIAAGNLDVELLADGAEVDSNTKLFNLVNAAGNDTWWEPGMVVYENLQVANVGTLALRYQLSLNFGKENDLNGHKLSEVLKIAVIDKVAANATRAEVLEAAKASKEVGTLASFRIAGELLPGEKSDEQTFVIFWEPNDNATDNLYNANNGQQTSDGEPLHIEFGVNLQATQKMHEEDSFGNDYDFVGFKPVANVNGSADLEVQATTNDMGNNATATTYVLNTAYQFKPTETYEEAQNSPYRYWHADFVVKADKDVPANSMALAGYYQAFCDGYNNGNWVALTANETITAGTEIRLVNVMGNGSITVNYEELCKYADITDPNNVGFMCGAADLTGENDGTTITVELRMYETTGDPLTTTGSKNEETGNYEVIGSYKHTFANEATTADELISLVEAGNNVTLKADITVDADDPIKLPAGSDVIIDLNGHTLSGISDATGSNRNMIDVNNASLTVRNGTVTIEHTGDNMGWNNSTNVFNVTNNATLNIEDATIENLGGSDMAFGVHLNNWGEVTLNVTDSTIESSYCAIRVFNSGHDMNNVTIEDSTIATAGNRALWVHNYTLEDFGNNAATTAAQQALLNFDIFGNGNTYIAETDKIGAPIRYGFTNPVYYNADGVQVVKAADQTALNNALNAGITNVGLAEGTYNLPASVAGKTLTISGTEDTVITTGNGNGSYVGLNGANITFDGVTIQGQSSGQYNGYAHAGKMTYNNCVIEGTITVYSDTVFNNCTFNLPKGCYVWTAWGANEVTYNECTFNTAGKAILVYHENGSCTVNVNDCVFNATAGDKAGAIKNQNCAAIEIDNSGKGVGTNTACNFTLNTSGNTYDSNFSGEWRIKTIDTTGSVTVNGTAYTTLAIDGKTMTIDAEKNVTVN